MLLNCSGWRLQMRRETIYVQQGGAKQLVNLQGTCAGFYHGVLPTWAMKEVGHRLENTKWECQLKKMRVGMCRFNIWNGDKVMYMSASLLSACLRRTPSRTAGLIDQRARHMVVKSQQAPPCWAPARDTGVGLHSVRTRRA
jgi:hypothetical protein